MHDDSESYAVPNPGDSKLLFLFPFTAQRELPDIESGRLPTERLYGLSELTNRGWPVSISDHRFLGWFGWLSKWLREYGFHFIDWKTVRDIYHHDVIIVKDEFSLMATLCTRLLGKKIIYLDAMFQVPTRIWKRWSVHLNARLANAVVAYSSTQASLWEEEFSLDPGRIRVMPYTIDLSFYRPREKLPSAQPYVLSVGRDMGRDFETMIKAMDRLDLGLKLVTLPYLVRDFVGDLDWVDVLERISYEELFELYSRAAMVIIPLRAGLTYPSGIRAVLEAIALKVPVIVSRTPVLEEYLEDDHDVLFVEPEDQDSMRLAIKRLLDNRTVGSLLEVNGYETVVERYAMHTFVTEFESLLKELS